MFLVYQIIVSLLLIASPLIIVFRILKQKEDKKRFIEKLELFPTQTISINSNNSTDKLLLDVKLKNMLTSAINNTDFNAIILVIYNEYIDKVEKLNTEQIETLKTNII